MTAHVRSDDQGKEMKISREIPAWGLITVALTLAGHGVSTYYGQQRLAENVEKLSVEVRALSSEVNKINIAQATINIQMADLQRRVAIIEDRMPAYPPPRVR